MTSPGRVPAWKWFTGWALAGSCLALGVSQIGVFTIPVGLVIAIFLSRQAARSDALGLLVGAGIVAVVVGLFNLDYSSCGGGGELRIGPGHEVSCGGLDGRPWLAAGLLLVGAGLLAYRRRPGP